MRAVRLGSALGVTLIGALLAGASSAARATTYGAITEQPTAIGSGPQELALDAGGNQVWFTERASGTLGVITEKGRYTRIPIPTKHSGPCGIVVAGDGSVWFTENTASRIGRRSAGRTTEFVLPAGSRPCGIANGPDGAVWFTEAGTNRIGRITASGRVRQFAVPGATSEPARITTGPDGALWFTEYGASAIGRITTTGVVTEYPTPTPHSGPLGIAPGAEGTVWFTENAANRIGEVTAQGAIAEYPLPAGSKPRDIAAGTDGAEWFTEAGTNQIGRIDSSGTVTQTPIPSGSSGPFGITTGVRGRIWFAESAANKVGQLASTDPHHQYVSVTGSFIQQDPPRALPGVTVIWTFFGPKVQSVSDQTGMGLYDSGPEPFVGTYTHTFTAAGSYPYASISGISATYKVLPAIRPASGPAAGQFTISWSTSTAAAGFSFDVVVKRPGTTAFVPWITGTTARSASFTPDGGAGVYLFRARLVDGTTSPATAAGWSPPAPLTVTS